MNTKTTTRKTKTSASSVARKRAPATTAAKTRPTVALATARKPSAKNGTKAAAPSAAAEIHAVAEPVRDSKQSRLIAMLSAKSGATINQMMKLTGWQAHTVRGTISGVLRKKLQLNVACDSSNASGENLYRIVGSAAGA